MFDLPIANITKDTFDQLDTAIRSGSGKLNLGTSGKPWGNSPDIFKAVMGQFPDSNNRFSGDVDFDANTNFGDDQQASFVIILLNGLDAPLRVKEYHRDSGDMTAWPYYDAIVHKPGFLGHKETFKDQVPGRETLMKNRSYGIDPKKKKADIETYGCGCWKFVRRGGFYGASAAISLVSDDPHFNSTMAIAGDVNFSGAPGFGFTLDLVQTGKDLTTFHNDTADKAKGIGAAVESHSITTGNKTTSINAAVQMTQMMQYNSYNNVPMQGTKLYTIAVSIRKVVT